MMKFAWLSDTHIGYQQYGLERRRKDFELAFELAVYQALTSGLKFFVHTGDLLHSNRPGPDAIMCLRRVHRTLIEHSARMIVISGNHDRTDPPWPSLLEPNEHNFGITVQDGRTFTVENTSFFCLPFMSPEQFKSMEWPKAHILLCHLAIREFIGFESLNAVSVNELPLAVYDAILVGDIHVNKLNHYQCDTKEHPVLVGYAGSTELCSESEPEEKYWMEMEVVDGKIKQATRRIIPTRPVFRLKLEALTDLDDHIQEIMIKWTKHQDATNDDRRPILFVEYPSDVMGVMERVRVAFNPDQWVLRFKPRLRQLAPTGVPLPPVEQELTVHDILRSSLALRADLLPTAEQLINQEIDPNVAIDEFIESRLRAVETATRSSDAGAPAVS